MGKITGSLQRLGERVSVLTSGRAVSLAISTGIGQVAVLCATPFTTRLFSPESVGAFAVFNSFIAVSSVVVALRMDAAIVVTETEEAADDALAASLVATVVVSALAIGVLSQLISHRLLGFGALTNACLPFGAAALILGSLYTTLRYRAVRENLFEPIGRSAMSQGFGRALVPLVTAPLGWFGLALGEVAGRSLGILALSAAVRTRWRSILRRQSLIHVRRTFVASWRYPLIVAPSALIDAAGVLLPIPLIAMTYGSAAAGWMLIVNRATAAPASLIGSSVADVFHFDSASLLRAAPERLRDALIRLTRRLLLISLVIYGVSAILAPLTATALLGHRWTQVGWLVAASMPLSVAALTVGPVTRLFLVLDIPQYKLVLDVVNVVLPIVVIPACYRGNVSLAVAVLIFSSAAALMYAVSFIVLTFHLRRRKSAL